MAHVLDCLATSEAGRMRGGEEEDAVSHEGLGKGEGEVDAISRDGATRRG
jgi:hypothetical protein